MNTYKIKSSATRAAKKELGEGWAEIAEIVVVDGMYSIQMKQPSAITEKAIDIIKHEVELIEQLVGIEDDSKRKADKKAELMLNKPVHTPALPAGIAVAKESAPAPSPALPAFLQIAPPAGEEVPELPADTAFMLEQQKAADAAANADAVNSVNPLRPRISTTELPTKKVWHIADAMMAAAGGMPKRKEVIEECVRQGIAYGTARTQYQHWFKCLNDSIGAPLAVIGKDGKISIPDK